MFIPFFLTPQGVPKELSGDKGGAAHTPKHTETLPQHTYNENPEKKESIGVLHQNCIKTSLRCSFFEIVPYLS